MQRTECVQSSTDTEQYVPLLSASRPLTAMSQLTPLCENIMDIISHCIEHAGVKETEKEKEKEGGIEREREGGREG